MVAFVSEHRRLFSHGLKVVLVSDSGKWGQMSYHCPPETQLEVYRILPADDRPCALTQTNWWQAVAHIESTDFGHVQEVINDQSLEYYLPAHVQLQDLLQRC